MAVPKRASAMSRRTPNIAMIELGRRRMCSRRLRRAEGSKDSASAAGAASSSVSMRVTSRIIDTWIELDVQYVYQKIHECVDHRNQHRDTHDRLVVRVLDGVDGVKADSRPGEDDLYQKGAAQQIAHLQPEQRDGRDQRISHERYDHHREAIHALGTRGTDIILRQHVHHAGARHAHYER